MSLEHLIFFFQAEDGIRDVAVTGVQTCALPISAHHLLALEPVGGAGVLLDRQRIVAESHDELAALGGERRGPEERGGAQQGESPDHGCLSVRGRSAKWRATAVMSSAATRSAVNGPVRPLPLTARMLPAASTRTRSGGSAPIATASESPAPPVTVAATGARLASGRSCATYGPRPIRRAWRVTSSSSAYDWLTNGIAPPGMTRRCERLESPITSSMTAVSASKLTRSVCGRASGVAEIGRAHV